MARAVCDALLRRTGTDHAALLAGIAAADSKKGR
jgi:hypothetical protein